MTNKVFNRVIETSSNTPSGASPQSISLSGTSPTLTFVGAGTSAGRKFVDKHSNSDVVAVHVYQTNSPNLFIKAKATFATGAPNTLSVAVADITDGSAGAGAFPTWTGAVTCVEESSAEDLQSLFYAQETYIAGLLCTKNGSTASNIDVSAGRCYVPAAGMVIDVAAQTVAAASTTDGAWNALWVDAAGVATCTAVDPTSTTYAGNARQDANGKRLVGWMLGAGSSAVTAVLVNDMGGGHLEVFYLRALFQLVWGVWQASFTSQSIVSAAPRYVTTDALLSVQCNMTSGTNGTIQGSISADGTNEAARVVVEVNNTVSFGGCSIWCPVARSTPQFWWDGVTAGPVTTALLYIGMTGYRAVR